MAHLRLCFLVFCLRYAESQDLKILDAEPIKVLMNENVTIPCKFGAQVWDLRIIGITWYYRLKEVEKTIYQFDGNRGVHVAKRSGSTMLIEEIKKGNGALHLPRIQINEEGEYKCVVFVTPSKAEGIFRLQVSAQPISSLLPKEVEVQIGTEKSVSCRMEGFYPQAFEISWWTSKYGVISEDTCTGYPEKNQDGTYNVTSYLRLQPSIEDNKNIYTCIVQHRSLSVPLMLNTTLTVKEKDSFLSVFIEAVVGNTLAWIVFVVCFLCIHKRHPKIVAPKVTDIIGNKVLVHNEEATLSCNVTGFWPEEITVIFSLVQPEKTSTVFYCWPIQRPANENDMQANVPLWNNMEITINRTQMFSQAPIKSHCDGTYSLSCKIIIVPDAEQHNGAEFCLTVKHKALEEPVHQKRLLSVIGRVPTVSEIMKPPRIIHQERIMLTCPINGFKQRPSKLTWIKKQQNEEKKLVVYDSGRDEVDYFSENYSHMISEHTFGDGTLSILSALSFTPSVTADNDAMFLCRIRNNATEEDVVKTLTLCVKAQATLDLIQAIPETPSTEDNIILSFRIHSFFPKTLEVYWYKNEDKVLENISISDVSSGPDGLCSCMTSIEFTPCKNDVGKEFTCRVGHESLQNHKEAKWTLKNLMTICQKYLRGYTPLGVSSPKALKILCEPRVPREGENVTLSCVVKDYYPPECEVRWFKGFQSIETAIVEAPQLCEETELYRRKSKLAFTPTKDDHNAEFSLEVIHHGRQLRRKHPLILKDFPIVKDIMVDSENVMYGKPVTLSCQVLGCDHKDLTITWFLKGDQFLNGLSSRMPPGNIKDNTIRYFDLGLTPTAFHYNKEFLCKVKHKNLQQSINKQIYLPLKSQPPVISDITMTPAEPDMTKTLCMFINVTDFAPKEIHIKWYNSWTEFSKELVTCSEPQIGSNFLYCSSSQAEFKPETSERDIKIRCEVTHSSTNTVLEKILQFNFKGCEPEYQKEEHIRNSVPHQ